MNATTILALLTLTAIDACELFRSKKQDWWVCSDCSSKEACCQLHVVGAGQDHTRWSETFLDSCKSLIAAVPVPRKGMYSFFRRSDTNNLELTDENPGAIVWETLLDNGADRWTAAGRSPFGDDKRQSHYVTSTLSQEGGMHRQWHHHLTGLASHRTTTSSVWLLLFLTEDVFVDVEDIGGLSRQIHTSDVINIELPSFDSPQHVIGIELEVLDHAEDIYLTTTLHLRYMEAEPNMSTTTLQLPNPIVWNQQRALLEKGTIVNNVATGISGDSWRVTAITFGCSIVGALLLLKDLWHICEWN